jgi:hypothetical protein
VYIAFTSRCVSPSVIQGIVSAVANMTTFSIRAFIPPLTRRCLPLQTTRRYAVQAPGAPMLEIFSGRQKWMQKERAAADTETSRSVDYLRDEVASRLCERVLVCTPHRSTRALLIDPGHKPPFPKSPRPRRKRLQHLPRPHPPVRRRPREWPPLEAHRHRYGRRLLPDTPIP